MHYCTIFLLRSAFIIFLYINITSMTYRTVKYNILFFKQTFTFFKTLHSFVKEYDYYH